MRSNLNRFYFALTPAALLMLSPSVSALEYPIGEPQEAHGLEIAAVYLQPVVMEPAMGLLAKDADIHLEADIQALEDNPNGLVIGSWVPYLEIEFELRKQGEDKAISGEFHPMVASDGPHYGANVKLNGPGKYHLTYTIKPPVTHGMSFMRHIDRETGVMEWFAPFKVEYDFVYAGIGKKGGY
ncbi:iron transporter [Hahella ganghwensis]|uniref:iron transporter n=1 Tax=Hahella ganghwensis TaxID=286420 RepID=UPI00035E6040|nr:iron transporter [Hahella ganghwensis]